MFEKKKKKDHRFIDDDPDTLEYSSLPVTNEERKRAEELLIEE